MKRFSTGCSVRYVQHREEKHHARLRHAGYAHFRSSLFPTLDCGRGAHAGHERVRGNAYPHARGRGHRGGPAPHFVAQRGGRGRGMPTPRWQKDHGAPASSVLPARGRGMSGVLRGGSEARGRGAFNHTTRVSRITEASSRRRSQYRIAEWRRDSVVAIIGINPADPNTHDQYHLSQGYNVHEPSLCIRRDTCPGLRHFFSQCPNIE